MKHIKISLFGLVAVMMLALPLIFVSAQATGTDNPADASFQLVPCSGTDCDFQKLMVMFNRIISFLLYLSVPLVLGMIMYTAFKFLTANGDPGKLVNAKKMLVPVAIGIFWVLGAYVVVYTVLDKLITNESIRGGLAPFSDIFK